ncbi:hypothetical protein [Roseomonas harenae]|uniref:hypothetical protein n=1 Tax=Muricoccus harenae TaxID=2692566 RepID=UPI0013312E70|nr:hypothetical protein [Roseomonas harenae]
MLDPGVFSKPDDGSGGADLAQCLERPQLGEPPDRAAGENGARVMARLAAFLLLCVGVQILSNGFQDLMIPVFRLPQPPG